MSSPFINPFSGNSPAQNPFAAGKTALPAAPTPNTPLQSAGALQRARATNAAQNTGSIQAISSFGGGKTQRQNPFLSALNTDSNDFQDSYGVNRPLKEAAYFGRYQGRELKGGARLFLLY